MPLRRRRFPMAPWSRCPLSISGRLQLPVGFHLRWEDSSGQLHGTDTGSFWGLKYCIEQRLPKVPVTAPEGDLPGSEHPHLAVMLWEQFTGAKDHMERSSRLRGVRVRRLTSPRKSRVPQRRWSCWRAINIRTSCTSTAMPTPACRSVTAEPPTTVSGRSSRRWAMKASGRPVGRLRADDEEPGGLVVDHALPREAGAPRPLRQGLRPGLRQPGRHPQCVRIGGCDADALGREFHPLFLDRGARAFVGTECMMTTAFAPSFGTELIQGLATGLSAGAASPRHGSSSSRSGTRSVWRTRSTDLAQTRWFATWVVANPKRGNTTHAQPTGRKSMKHTDRGSDPCPYIPARLGRGPTVRATRDHGPVLWRRPFARR